MAFWNRVSRLFGSSHHKTQMERAFLEARAALGERMYAVGIDDGRLGSMIAAVAEKIQLAGTKVARECLETERDSLILKLADAALEVDAPLPGADREYEIARAQQASLLAQSVSERPIPCVAVRETEFA